MNLIALGHSSFLLEMESRTGSTVRILADPWLSDYLIGDLQGRFPRLDVHWPALGTIDAVFLSHSHTDHCDPYSLLEIWGSLETRPVLILPQSMRFLEGLFREYLESVEILFLEDETKIEFRGLHLTAFFNPETRATNEDDVMLLVAENGTEVFVSEADAVLPMHDPDVREWIGARLGESNPKTIAFFAIKNQGDATMSMLAASDLEDRRERLSRCIESSYDEIESLYAWHQDLDTDPWRMERLVRLIGGQGICFPQEVNADWNRVLFPIRLEDRVRMEREVASRNEFCHQIEEVIPGEVHVLQDGTLQSRQRCAAITLRDREGDRAFDPTLELFDSVFRVAPLRDETRDPSAQRARVLNALNQRFLPWWIGARNPPVEHVLASTGGSYRIRVRYGTIEDHVDVEYRYGFDTYAFVECPIDGDPHEFYWANDIEDALDGRADEFSLFCRRPIGGSAQRFWTSLGMPYLNSDLIERKLRLHFERAVRGEPLSDWAKTFYS